MNGAATSSRRISLSATITILTTFVVALSLASLLMGRFTISLRQALYILGSRFFAIHQTWPDAMETVLLQIRLPRIAAAVVVGGVLSSAGAACQSLFRNPLVSPAILGVSSGAGFGAAMAMLLSLPWFGIQATAFAFGLLAVVCSLTIGRVFGPSSLTLLVLAGIVVSAMFEALISLAKFVADPVNKLPSITFWLLGGLSRIGPRDIGFASIPMFLGLAVLFFVRWRLNVLALGEEEAQGLGVNAKRLTIVVVLAATLMTAAAVSICGIVGWVGLLIPHIARALVGPRFESLLPVSLLLGAGFLLAIDDIARSTSVEVPLGVLTALIGAPFFIFLLTRARRAWA